MELGKQPSPLYRLIALFSHFCASAELDRGMKMLALTLHVVACLGDANLVPSQVQPRKPDRSFIDSQFHCPVTFEKHLEMLFTVEMSSDFEHGSGNALEAHIPSSQSPRRISPGCSCVCHNRGFTESSSKALVGRGRSSHSVKKLWSKNRVASSLRDFFSTCRIRSRVKLNALPIASRV